MPINEPAETFRDEATNLAGRMLDVEQLADPEALARDVHQGLYVGDVLHESEQFTTEVGLLRRLGLPFPLIRIGGRDVPISLMNDFPFPDRLFRYLYPEYFYDFVRNWERTSSDTRFVAEIDKVVEVFKSGLIDFLATRIASVEEFFGHRDKLAVLLTLPITRLATTTLKTVGFKVDVHTATPSLRVHVSPTFRRNWRYFGMPTSPVISTLTGGIYEFGVDGGPYSSITADPGTFDIPYQTVSPNLTL
jgi:hypothetical protein